MAATLIRIDRNGTKYYEGMIPCDRCGGHGESVAWKYTGWTCYKCGGAGVVPAKWVERTPEYEAKLAERRRKRLEAKLMEEEGTETYEEAVRKRNDRLEAERERIEAEKRRIEAEKAISKYVGVVGEKYTTSGTYIKTAYYDTKIGGWMDTRIYIHTFKDEEGNVLVWKTSSGVGKYHIEEGDAIEITGTVKDHFEYKGEKETSLIRCKIVKK